MDALQGLKVLELGQLIAGPFAGKTLADFGADVIKVEPVDGGDPLRKWRLLRDGTSVWWEVQSRNKRSVALDLRSEEGQAAVRALAAQADVLIENFKPGTLEDWGLGWDALHAGERCERLSRGMRQKVALAGALVHDPRLILLDEPLTGLDAGSARVVKEVLRARVRAGCTVVMTTHILDVAERVADRIGVMAHGTLIAQGTLDELRALAGAGHASLEDTFLELVARGAGGG